ncbi:MAG: serine/threonine protein kinase [Agathobacter sp.]
MSTVIAGIYEIEQQIGAGGGGVVYLGRHVRLNKTVVLKADKRKLSVGTEKLRREVDMLKNLSQTYIPQVYDFVQENDTVYTVMDYIDGVSMDKVLASGNPIPQRDIVKWACQLLEALNYLHNQKPHGILHGDIKPANIMLRTNGDICLIDYNIALALGEDGAVKVGFSSIYSTWHQRLQILKSHQLRKSRFKLQNLFQKGAWLRTNPKMCTV